MADGDAPSIHVEAVIGQAQRVAAVEDLACKGLVQFPKADVADAEAEAIEAFGNGEHGPYPHFIRLSACNGHSEISSKRLPSPLLGHLHLRHHRCCRTVRKQTVSAAAREQVNTKM